ncbi:hypothetical protein CVT26_006889 [Gymnopilus dilepis]|uniref:Uncharacterized protein n=1 Tax=Gymnopilus dilepis TaxID=231916 RepID=A0A409W0Y0_9AGAR|nr:hypothetical protein CVT26_006889 [Gymnopilus dilepis]
MNPSGSATPPAQISRAHEIQQQLELLQRQCQQVLSSRSPLELESTDREFRPPPPPRRTGILNEAANSAPIPNSLSPPTRSTSHPRAPSPPLGPLPPPTRTERPRAPVREQGRGRLLPPSSREGVAVPHARMSSSQFFLLPSARRANSGSTATSATSRQAALPLSPGERPAAAESPPSRGALVHPSQAGLGLEYDGRHVPPPPLPFRLPSSSSSSPVAAAHPAPNAVRPAEPVSPAQHQAQPGPVPYNRHHHRDRQQPTRHPSSNHLPTGSGSNTQSRRASTAGTASHPAHAGPPFGPEAPPTLVKDGSRRGTHPQSPQATMSSSLGPPLSGVESHSRPRPALDLPHPDSFLSPLANPSHGDRGVTHTSLHSRPQNPSAASTYRSSQNSSAPSNTTSTHQPPPLSPNGFHARSSSLTPAAAEKTPAAVYDPQGCVNPADPTRKNSSPSSLPTPPFRPSEPSQALLQSQRDDVAQLQGQVQRQAQPRTHAHGQASALAITGQGTGDGSIRFHDQQAILQSRSHPNLNLRGWESGNAVGAAADQGGRAGGGAGRQRPSRIVVPPERDVRARAYQPRPPQPQYQVPVNHDFRPHPHAPLTQPDRRARAYTIPHAPPPLLNSQTQTHIQSQARVPQFHVHAPHVPMPVSLPLSMPALGPRPVAVSLQMPRHPALDPASVPKPPGSPDLLDALAMDQAAGQLLHAAVEDALLPLRLAMEVDMPRICGELEVGLQGLGHGLGLQAATAALNVGMLEGATVIGPTKGAGVTGTGVRSDPPSNSSLDAQNAPREHEPFEVAVERLRLTKGREELREELRTNHALWEAERKGWEEEVVKWAGEKANWREEKARFEHDKGVYLEEKAQLLEKQAKWDECKAARDGEREKWVAEKAGWEEEKSAYESTLEEKERELQEQKANNKQLGRGNLDVCLAMDTRGQLQAQVEAQEQEQEQMGATAAAVAASSPVAAETQLAPDHQVLTQLQERADSAMQHLEVFRLETQLDKTTRIMQGYREECKRLRAEKETLEFQLLVRNGSVVGTGGGPAGVVGESPGVAVGGSPGAAVGSVVAGRGQPRGRPRGHGQRQGQRQRQGRRDDYSYAAYPLVPTLTLGRASTAAMTTSSDSSTPTTTTTALAAKSMATTAAPGEAAGPDHPTYTALVPSTSSSSSSLMSTGTTATSSSSCLSPSTCASSSAATSGSISTSMETTVKIGSGTVRIKLPLFSQPTSTGAMTAVTVSESGYPIVVSASAQAATPTVVDPPLPPGQLDISSSASAHSCAPPLPLASFSSTSTPSDPNSEVPTPSQDPDVNEGLDLSFESQGDADEAEEGRRSLTAADVNVGIEREDRGGRKSKRHRTEWEEPKFADIKKLKLDPDLDSSVSTVTSSSIQDFAVTDVKNEPDPGADA